MPGLGRVQGTQKARQAKQTVPIALKCPSHMLNGHALLPQHASLPIFLPCMNIHRTPKHAVWLRSTTIQLAVKPHPVGGSRAPKCALRPSNRVNALQLAQAQTYYCVISTDTTTGITALASCEAFSRACQITRCAAGPCHPRPLWASHLSRHCPA